MSYQSTKLNQYSVKTCIHQLIAADSVFPEYCNHIVILCVAPASPTGVAIKSVLDCNLV
ncbi:MAG: hypothetical protein PHC34_03870 [Candidatus Gastranaerophilales bacterium]|nr:hypothetical protein [Candidatus Gastranaerophilales bacterium]